MILVQDLGKLVLVGGRLQRRHGVGWTGLQHHVAWPFSGNLKIVKMEMDTDVSRMVILDFRTRIRMHGLKALVPAIIPA